MEEKSLEIVKDPRKMKSKKRNSPFVPENEEFSTMLSVVHSGWKKN